jgi:hypothetical protein
MGDDMTYTELSLLITAIAHLLAAFAKLWRSFKMIHK